MVNDELIELKRKTADELKRIDIDSYSLDETDERLPVYLRACVNNPARHNLYELLAVKRFFEFLNKFDFRPAKACEFESPKSRSSTIKAATSVVFPEFSWYE